MFDTMTMTKLAGSLFGALLVFLLASWVSVEIYAMDKGHGGDGNGQAYAIDTGADDAAADEEEAVDFATLYAAADPSKGERVFNKCSACHKLEAGQNGVGPYLYGVVGRPIDAADGFNYSGALEKVAEEWTPENLYAFLENPRSWAPGTTMAFNGLKSSEERVNLIAYLDLLDGEMTEVAAPASEEEASVEPEATETEEAATEEAATEEAATEEAVTEEAATEEAATEEAATEEAVTEEAATEEAVTEEAVTEEAVTEEAVTEEAATEEAATEEAVEEAAATDTASGFAALVAAADVDQGARVFNKCKACHVLEAGVNRVGPYLHGVVGRDIAAAEGFNFSNALSGLEGVWTYDELSAFLENPRGYAQGNRMTFAGLKSEEERAAVIAYIESMSN